MSPNNLTPVKSPRKAASNNNRNIVSSIEDKLKQLKVKYGEDVVDPEKSPERIKEKEKIKQSMQRSEFLYERAKMKTQVHKIVVEKSQELKKDQEMQECTFKPRVNLEKFLNNTAKGNNINPRYVYDRQFGLLITRREK
jgi:hypothetical protein